MSVQNPIVLTWDLCCEGLWSDIGEWWTLQSPAASARSSPRLPGQSFCVDSGTAHCQSLAVKKKKKKYSRGI